MGKSWMYFRNLTWQDSLIEMNVEYEKEREREMTNVFEILV